MAVFMLNICKFNDCGLTFKHLGKLIQHIEETHIDYDPQVVEQKEKQQPPCVPLSYVLRFFTDAARREIIKPLQVQTRPSNCHASIQIKAESPTGDDNFTSEAEDSNDSWATNEEFSTDYILRYGNRGVNRSQSETNIEKPYACPIPGCNKRYKNVNGIKYHSKNGHKNNGKIRKAFKCPCGKNYKTQYGLKNHTIVHHKNTSSPVKYLGSEMDVDQDERIFQEEEATLTEEIKVSAMGDHVYVKQNRPMHRDCKSLGILTPTSTPPTPPLSTQSLDSTVYDRKVRSIHNYFAVQNSGRDYIN